MISTACIGDGEASQISRHTVHGNARPSLAGKVTDYVSTGCPGLILRLTARCVTVAIKGSRGQVNVVPSL